MRAVAEAVAAGNITPSEGAEYDKAIDGYVRAYQAAELDDRVVRAEQLTDEELYRIAAGRASVGRLLLEQFSKPAGSMGRGDENSPRAADGTIPHFSTRDGQLRWLFDFVVAFLDWRGPTSRALIFLPCNARLASSMSR